MRKLILAISLFACMNAGGYAQGYPLYQGPYPSNPWSIWNTGGNYGGVYRGGGNTYNPNFGYSDRMNWGGYRGSSAPFQGNFRFAPGYGYGSIYGNAGHPGFNRFTGPAWAVPYGWGIR